MARKKIFDLGLAEAVVEINPAHGHDMDYLTQFCLKCGQSAETVDNYGLMYCVNPDDVIAISHVVRPVLHRKLSKVRKLALYMFAKKHGGVPPIEFLDWFEDEEGIVVV